MHPEAVRRRRVALAACAAALLMLAAAFVADGRAQSAATAATVRFVLSRGAVGDWAPYVAAELGYFKDEGIDFQSTTLERPGDIATALMSDRADIATTSLPLAIAGAVAGAPMKLVSATQMATPGGGYNINQYIGKSTLRQHT